MEAGMGLKHSIFPSVFPMFRQEQPSDNINSIKMGFVTGNSSQKSKNENLIRRSLAFGGTSLHEQCNLHPVWDADYNGETPSSIFGDDLDCSVRLDSVPFSKSFNSACDPSSFNPIQEPSGFNMFCETSSLNPMQEPTSFNPISEPHMEYEWDSRLETDTIIYKEILTGANSQKHEAIKKDSEFSFQSAPSEDDDEVTESKIRAFLDEKALELKRLQSPLYEEFRSIWNVAQQNEGTESLIAPLSPSPIGRPPVMNSRSPSKGSSISGATHGFSSRDSDASVNSDSPHGNASVNLGSYLEVPSPKLKEWKGLFQETQQFLPSPSILNSTELQKLWKEELHQELEMKREEKRRFARLAGNSKSSSPNSKSSSPNDKVLQRHGGGGRLLCASPTRLQV